MKSIVITACFLLFLCSCNNSKIDKAKISFYNETGVLDSVIINNTEDLEVIQEYLSVKEIYNDKMSRIYFLEIQNSNGSKEEFSCNGHVLNGSKKYFNPDTFLQRKYLKVINSYLPIFLQQ